MTNKGTGFYITHGHGFHIVFENGYTVSVQFGPGNYCDHYDREIGFESTVCGKEGSSTAECAVWHEGGTLLERPEFNGETVGARMTPAQVQELMAWAAAQ